MSESTHQIPQETTSGFPSEIRNRIHATRESLTLASAEQDDFMVEVRLGELETLARLAADHDVHVDGLDETFAAHGRTTPAFGVGRVLDLRGDL